MSSIGTLWTYPEQGRGKRIRAAAAFAGLQLDLPASYEHYVDNKKPEFLAKFPHGKIPAFESKDGFKVFESTAIAEYVSSLAPNSTLLGSSAEERALISQWISFADNEIDTHVGIIYALLKPDSSFRTAFSYNKSFHNGLHDRAVRSLKTLEQHLSTRTYLVTERITLADITLAIVLQRAVTINLDAALRAELPNTIRHLETIANYPTIKDIIGPLEYIEKALQFVPPPKKEAKPAAAAPAAPKAEKKKPAKEEADEADDDLVPKEEPKAKNPLDFLPKSTFNLEDWKRAYSNKDTRGADGALEWFYQNYDKAGFSAWRVDFKYNNELTQTFMSSNQIGGFFNRLEASRKYLFGSVGVLGVANDSIISGALIVRGQDVKPVVDVAPDWESYGYKKLDLENTDDKAFFEAALAWDLELDGKKWVDGKNFK